MDKRSGRWEEEIGWEIYDPANFHDSDTILFTILFTALVRRHYRYTESSLGFDLRGRGLEF